MSSLQVCKVTCCGIANFEQHCSSKRHLRKAALEAASITAAAAGAAGGRPAAPPEHRGTTYMGRQAQCRNYCKQVGCILHRPVPLSLFSPWAQDSQHLHQTFCSHECQQAGPFTGALLFLAGDCLGDLQSTWGVTLPVLGLAHEGQDCARWS